jgi:plasmid stabilization system protein ParE
MHEGKFAGLRMWRVTGFENFLIFYHPLKDGVAIERVFHAKQDYQRVLKWLEFYRLARMGYGSIYRT